MSGRHIITTVGPNVSFRKAHQLMREHERSAGKFKRGRSVAMEPDHLGANINSVIIKYEEREGSKITKKRAALRVLDEVMKNRMLNTT